MIRIMTVAATALLLITTLHADEFRTWSDSPGKFKIEAQFIDIEMEKVVLEKKDGTRVKIDLSKLDPKDRTEAMKAKTDAAMNKNPFEEEKKEKSPFEPNEGKASVGLKEIDWSDARPIMAFGGEWKSTKIETAAPLGFSPRPIPLPATLDFAEEIKGMVTSPASKKVASISVVTKHGRDESSTSRLILSDLSSGKFLREIRLSGNYVPLDLTPDGKKLLVRRHDFFEKEGDVLELWNVENAIVEKTHQWKASQASKEHQKKIIRAKFLQEGTRLYVQQEDGTFSIWDMANLKPLFTGKMDHGVSPAISPQGKILAGTFEGKIAMIDLANGDSIGSIPYSNHQAMHASLAFSPDGKRLAVVGQAELAVFDLENGQREITANCRFAGHDSVCFWTNATSIFFGSTHSLTFFDTSLQYPVWSYSGMEKIIHIGDAYVGMVVKDHRQRGLVVNPLPHPAAVSLLEQSKKDVNFFVFKAGDKLRIDVSGIAEPRLREEARKGLEKCVKDCGSQVSDQAKLTLKAEIKRGEKDHQVSYEPFMRPFPRINPGIRPGFNKPAEPDPAKTHTVPAWEYVMRIEGDGKVYWNGGGGNHPPPIIHLKENETIADHLKQYNEPSAAFFQHVVLPKFLARNTEGNSNGGALRSSVVTTNGVR